LQQSSEQLQSDTPLLLAERILMSQAQSLNAVFCDMAKRANRQEYVANMDKLLRLALKAQSQCRATLETLSNIKNPQSYSLSTPTLPTINKSITNR
jgi:hypothetical protein